MTEASGSQSLARVLALCALALSAQAQARLLTLLPEDLAAEAGDWLRRSAELAAGATSKLESALLARCIGDDDDDASDLPTPPGLLPDALPGAELPATDLPGTDLPEVLLACLLAGAPAGNAAALLAQLPLATQGAVVALVATSTPGGIVRALPAQERQLLAECRLATEHWGVHAACDILRALPGQRRLRRALTATTEVDAEAAAIIQSHLFDFDDLTRLRMQELQLLLSRVDNVTLARALVGAGERVSTQIFANTSERRALLLQDELELGVDVSDEEVDAARNEVMAVVRKLYEHGDIVTYFGSISRAGEELDDDDEGDEEEENDRDPDETDGEQEPAPSVDRQTPSAVVRMVLVLIGTAVVLVGVALLLLPENDGRTAAKGNGAPFDRATVEAESSSRVLMVADSPGELQSGETLRGTGTVDTILEFPSADGARVAVAPGAQVEGLEAVHESGEDHDAASHEQARLYLRVGRVTVTAVTTDFTVRTPMGEVVGSAGSIFTVRVVLDASTTARVRQGTVDVWSLSGRRLARLSPGQGLRIDSSGGVELSR